MPRRFCFRPDISVTGSGIPVFSLGEQPREGQFLRLQPIFRSYVATSLVRDLLACVSFAEQFVHSGERPETNLGLDPSIQVLSSSPSEPSKASKKVSCCCKKKDGKHERRPATRKATPCRWKGLQHTSVM